MRNQLTFAGLTLASLASPARAQNDTQAISRALTVYTGPQVSTVTASSRLVTVYTGPEVRRVLASSRLMTVYTGPPISYTRAVSRSVTVVMCYPNCDGSTLAPRLNVNDFTCFLNKYGAASVLPHAEQVNSYANCDGSATAPVLNVNDFFCFLNRYAAGCF